MLATVGVCISMSDKGKPAQNGIAERFLRTLKAEHIDNADYGDFQDARNQREFLSLTFFAFAGTLCIPSTYGSVLSFPSLSLCQVVCPKTAPFLII
jgi:transposase InsO family protein